MSIQLVCATCGAKFAQPQWQLSRGHDGHFCSVPCRVVATIAGYTRLPRWIVAATRDRQITVEVKSKSR